jgi:hypothetical protein
LAIAARVSKYGISIEQAMWHLPLAVLNQLVTYDELANGRTPRWATNGKRGAAELDAIMADALTPQVEHGQE